MGPAIASSLDLTVSISSAVPFSVTIPKGFQFLGPDEIIFEAAEPVTFPPSSTAPLNVPCYEGQTFTDQFVSDGTASQVFQLTRLPEGSFVVLGTVVVVVNGTTWSESEFLEFESSSQFEVGYNDDPPTIRFGDGVAGSIPSLGATIDVSYVGSRGLAGRVNKETVTDVVDTLVQSFTPIDLLVNNTSGSIGGDDPETLDSVKVNAPKVFKSRYVAVTREDYEALSGRYADPLFGRVSVAQAIAARSAAEDITLINYLNEINSLANSHVAPVQADVDAIQASLASITGDMATISTNLGSIVGLTSALAATDLPSALAGSRASKNLTQEITIDAGNIATAATAVQVLVNALPVAGTSQLTSGDKTQLLALIATILSEQSSIVTDTGTIASHATSGITILGAATDKVNQIGINTTSPGSYLYAIDQERISTNAQVTAAQTAATEIETLVVDISEAVGDQTDLVFAHVDSFLASDCKANLVVVPILSLNSSGFYAAPSTGLIKSLQAFLDARKEVTQTVSVTSGANSLVAAVLTVDIGVLSNYSQSVTETAVVTAVDGLLKNRSFGVSLYVSDVHKTVAKIAGVGYANVTIQGFINGVFVDSSLNDSQGNLIIGASKVVTKGTLTVTSTALAGTITS